MKAEFQKQALVVIPTYNEVENITEMVKCICSLTTSHAIDILVVDSNSPDGTGDRLEQMKKIIPRLHVLHQPRKMGLGCAYLEAFRYVQQRLPHRYDLVITMDADFSHHPRYIQTMFNKVLQCDLVVGSRYIEGGKLCNWPTSRKWLSRFANSYAKNLTGIPLNDLTSGFHCFRLPVLMQVLQHEISAEGYAFLIELKYCAVLEGFKILEIPIEFADRTKGSSKISKRVILESAIVVLKIFFQRLYSSNRRHGYLPSRE